MVAQPSFQETIDYLGKQVLYVAPNIRWKGGISSVVMEYKKAIRTFQYQPSTTSEDIRITLISFPILVLQFCLKLATRRAIKIVHIHGASQGSFYRKYVLFLLAKYVFRKKVIYHIHGAMYHLFYENASPFVQKRVQHFVNTTDALIVLSDWWKNYFEENFQPRIIRIVPNIVSATDPKDIAHVPSERIKFLFLGRIGERKGVYDLLEVMHQHQAELGNKYLLELGGDGETEKLQSLINQYHLEENVKFLGFVVGSRKEQLLRAADVYILPSYNEGLPISILEAMSFGLPIISTEVGGIPEVVLPYENGLLISAGDQSAIYESIKFFMDHPEKIESYGTRSYEIVSQRYFPRPVMSTLIKLYDDLLL